MTRLTDVYPGFAWGAVFIWTAREQRARRLAFLFTTKRFSSSSSSSFFLTARLSFFFLISSGLWVIRRNIVEIDPFCVCF